MPIIPDPQRTLSQTGGDATPPTHCPACGSELDHTDENNGYLVFKCGQVFVFDYGPSWMTCSKAYDAAVSLRADLERVTAERDAAVVELKRYKTPMACGHATMMSILNYADLPECSVCWAEGLEAERDALRAQLEKVMK